MKVKKICLGIALAMSLVGCNNEEYTINSKETKLEASVESAIDSRVGFDKTNNWAFYWHNGDQIWVNGSPMTTSAEDKSKTATFIGYGVNTNSGYAVYPYNQNLYQIDGTSLTWNFPDTYDYTSVDNDFFKSAQAIPMYAKVENGSAHFYHMGAIVAIKLNDWKFIGDHVFTLKTSKKITGGFSTDLSSDPKFETTTAEEDVVIINYTRPSDATTTSVVFYVPVPVGNYDIEVAVAVDEITYFNKSYTGVNVAVGDIVWAEYGESTLDGSDGSNKTVASVGEIDEEILSSESEDLTVNVTSEVTGTDNTINIPTTLNTNTTTFSFASVAEGAKITIQNEDGGAYDGQVIIEVPVGATIPEVEAKIPDGEVYIKQGNVTTLVVASAENTTIIGAGVEVGTLTVMKGNVRIENGGKVGAINRSTGNTKTVYVIYESITAPNITVGEGVVLVSAAEWNLRKAIEMGGTVILTENLNLNSPIEITKGNATLDLNGKTITAANGDAIVVSNNAELTITGNGIVKVEKGANGCAVWAHHGGKVTIENGTFSTNDDADGDRCDCIYAGSTADMSAGTITINGGTFKYDGENEEGHKFLLNKKDNTASAITVYGGVFHKFNPAISYGEPNAPVDFVAGGSIVVETSEGVFEVLSSVNNVVTLSKDVAVNSPIEITKGNVTLDLNGKTITAANGDAIVVSNNAELTITGNGIVKVEKGANGCAVWAHHGGKVTIENGTFSTNDDADGDRCDCIYAGSTADMSAGTITINGGTFKYDGENEEGHKFLLNKKDNTASAITVYGGVFHKFNPAISYGEPNAPVNFVAEGYESIQEGDNYIVKK